MSKIKCPICNKELNCINNTHLKTHNLTYAEFKTLYPNAKTYSEESAKKRKDASSKVITKYNKSDIARKKASEHCKIMNQDSKFQSNRAKKGWTKERRKEKSIQMTKVCNDLHSLPKYKDAREKIYKNRYGIKHKYKGLNLRSTLELNTVKLLEKLGLDFEYETLQIPYVKPEDNKTHIYLPDFYIKSKNLIIECKYSIDKEDEIVLAKKQACLDLGYAFMFVDENMIRLNALEIE